MLSIAFTNGAALRARFVGRIRPATAALVTQRRIRTEAMGNLGEKEGRWVVKERHYAPTSPQLRPNL